MSSKNKIVTLQDVADFAGVSKAVASRALSAQKRPISQAKKERVVKAASELGYVANPFAKSLITKSTGLVAIVVNHMSDFSDLALFDSLLATVQELGKQPLFIRLNSPQDIVHIKQHPFIPRVDAAIIFSDLLEVNDIPNIFLTDQVIYVNGKIYPDALSIVVDETQGIKDAVQYAKSNQIEYARIFAGRKTSEAEKKRVETYINELSAQSISVLDIQYCHYSYQETLSYLDSHHIDLADSSVGYFCTADAMAMATLDHFRDKKPSPPLIIGFDDTEFSRLQVYQFPTIGYSKRQFHEALSQIIVDSSNQVTPTEKHIEIGSHFISNK